MAAKAKYPRAILMVQIGSFFEVHGLDALLLQQYLDCQLTGSFSATPGRQYSKILVAGIPLAGLHAAVSSLVAAGFSVAVHVEGDMSHGGKTKARHLVGVYNQTNPMVPPEDPSGLGPGSGAALQYRSMIGVAGTKTSFTLYELAMDLRQIRVTRGLSILHMLRKGLRSIMEGVHTRFYDGADPCKGFREQALMEAYGGEAVELQETLSDPSPSPLVYNLTALQLGLKNAPGMFNLLWLAAWLPACLAPGLLPASRLCCTVVAFIRRLLLCPPPMHVALHLHAATQQLAASKQALPELATGMATERIAQALWRGDGDAPSSGTFELLSCPAHAGVCASVLAFLQWCHSQPVQADALRPRLAHALALVDDLVVPRSQLLLLGRAEESSIDFDDAGSLESPSHNTGSSSSSSSSSGRSSSSRGSRSSSSSNGGGGTPPDDRPGFKEWRQRKEWGFRNSVKAERMADLVERVDAAAQGVEAALDIWYTTLVQDYHRVCLARTSRKMIPVIAFNAREGRLGVQANHLLPHELVSRFRGAGLIPGAKDGSGDRLYGSQDLLARLAEHEEAVEAANQRAVELLAELCQQLEPDQRLLVLGAHLAVATAALNGHAEEANRRGWCLPQLLASPHTPAALPLPTSTLAPPHSQSGAGANGSRHYTSSSSDSGIPTASPQNGQYGQEGLVQELGEGGGRGGDRGGWEDGRGGGIQLRGFWPYWMDPGHGTVANDLVVDRMLLLTGPNAAGKSTVMRSVASCVLLASCGLMVPAAAACIPPVTRLLLRNFSGDSPREGLSSFAMELEDIRLMLHEADEHSLVLLDELGKGTEVDAGTSVAAALLDTLCSRGCVGLFATHLHELVPLTQSSEFWPQAGLGYACMGITADSPRRPTWRIQDGWCFESLAHELAESRLPAGFSGATREWYRRIREGRYRTHSTRLVAAKAMVDIASEADAADSTDVECDDDASQDVSVSGSDDADAETVLCRRVEAAGQVLLSVASATVSAAGTASALASSDTGTPGPVATPKRGRQKKGVAAQQDPVLPTSTEAGGAASHSNSPSTDPAGMLAQAELQGCTTDSMHDLEVVPVRVGQMVPASASGKHCVYVLSYPGGPFYAGQTGDLARRLKAHRTRSTRFPHRGPSTALAYVQLPPEHAALASRIERDTILALDKAGFVMASKRDGYRKNVN
ncbi:muts domain V-domain-containing protein [Haematococcus lacustris]